VCKKLIGIGWFKRASGIGCGCGSQNADIDVVATGV
jgi:hypothetical protein